MDIPWEEGQEEGPRASESNFLKIWHHLFCQTFCFRFGNFHIPAALNICQWK